MYFAFVPSFRLLTQRPNYNTWLPCRNKIVGCGVADGVYQWKEVGIDSGHFSRGLMQAAQKQVSAGNCDALKGAGNGWDEIGDYLCKVPVPFWSMLLAGL